MKIDLENSGFTLCQARPRLQPHNECGVWKSGEAVGQHLGFESLRKLYAPKSQQLDTDEIPFVQMRK